MPASEQAFYRFEDAVRDRLVESELPQILNRWDYTEDDLFDIIFSIGYFETFTKTWGRPGIKLTPFEIRIAERIYQGE